MPRRPRREGAGAIHHAIARGNGGTEIVRDGVDRHAFVSRLGVVAATFGWRVHAYCLLDTHFHLVVETSEPTLGAGMQRLVGGHAFAFNRRHGRSGHLFCGPYYSVEIESEAHLIEACVYVVLNPVRAGLVEHASEWTWSSYRACAGLVEAQAFLATELLPDALSPDPRAARALYRQLVDETAARERPRVRR